MPRSLADINSDLQAKQAELEEAQSDGTFSETLDNVDSDLQGVRDFIDKTTKDITEASEDIGEEFEELSGMVTDMGELLGTEGVEDAVGQAGGAVESVQGGLKSTTNVLDQVQEGLNDLAEAIDLVQEIDDLRTAEGAEALEQLAKVFEMVVEKLGGFIELVPGLGAFLQLYAAGIRNIAISAGIMEEIVGRNQLLYQEIRPGQYLYLTPAVLNDMKIRRLEAEYAQLYDEAFVAAGAERESRNALETEGTASPVDIVAKNAIRNSVDARPALDSSAYQAWVASGNGLAAAKETQSTALGEYLTAKDNLDRAEIGLESTATNRPVGQAEADYEDASKAFGRAAPNLNSANAGVDAALTDHKITTAAHRAEVAAYNEAVKTEIYRLNGYEHLSEGELATLAIMYPQWDIRGWQPAAATAAATGIGAAAVGATPTAGAVGGAAPAAGVSAGMSSGTKKLVMIGGGIFAVMMLFVVILILPGDSTTPGELKTAPTAAETEVTSAAQTDPPPAEAGEEVDEPTDTDPQESDTGGFEQTSFAALNEVAGAHGLEQPFLAFRPDIVGDVGACGGGPDSGPGADVVGIVADRNNGLVTVVVPMAQPPTTSAEQFSFAVLLKVTLQSGLERFFLHEVHNGRWTTGEQDAAGNVMPGDGSGTAIDETAVTFRFMEDGSDMVVLLSVQGFNLPTEGDSIGCDTAIVAAQPFPSSESGPSGSCTEGETTACLNNDRFGVEVTDEHGDLLRFQAAVSDGAVFGEGTTSGLVRVLNACDTNGHIWVFSDGFMGPGATAWSVVTVTDTGAGEEKVYTKSLNPLDATIQDTAAFDACQ